MKNKIKLSAILLLAGLLASVNASFAQCYANATYYGVGIPDELQSKNGILAILQGNNTAALGTQTMTGVGINNNTPNYMADILGVFVGDGVNVGNGGNNPRTREVALRGMITI